MSTFIYLEGKAKERDRGLLATFHSQTFTTAYTGPV